MLKACSYCGGIHEGECPKKPKRNYRQEQKSATRSRIKERKFRSSQEWQRCRQQVLERDKHMCRLCLAEEHYITVHEALDVHHIEPLHKAWAKRTTKKNLITLCKRHHHLADQGEYTAEYLKKIIISPPTIE